MSSAPLPIMRNKLLSSLSPAVLGQMTPMLHRTWLEQGAQLLAVEDPPDYAYFPETCIVSVIACGENQRTCYLGLYGFEGFGSMAAALGVPTSPNSEVVQSAGFAYRMRVSDLHMAAASLPEFGRLLHCFIHIFTMQIAFTAFSNGHTRVDQRLARWLLMYQDRVRASTLAITHQRLSDILGVRRSGVTEAVHVLEGNKLIRAQRGLIDILDRPRLEVLTAGTYGKPEAEYRRLI
jgi:CRP-like cAMP-binding protein